MIVPDTAVAPGSPIVVYHGELDAATEQAEALRGNYEHAIRSQAWARSGLTLFLVPLGAAAFAIGAGGGHSAGAALLGMGAAGAGAYTLGTYAISSPRDRVYLAGINALDCALNATLPLRVTETDFDSLRKDVSALSDNLNYAESLTPPPEASLSRSSRKALRASETLLANISEGGFLLRNQLHEINAAVSAQLLQTEPDISTIPTALQGLKGLSGTLASGLGTPARPQGAANGTVHDEYLGQSAAGAIALAASDRLRDSLSAVQVDLAEAAARARAGGDARKCQVATIGGLQLGIASDTLTLAQGETYDVPVIASKSAAPTVIVAGPTGGVTADRAAVGNGVVVRIVAAASAQAQLGPWVVTVQDPGSDTFQQVTVELSDGTHGDTGIPPGPAPGGGKSSRTTFLKPRHLDDPLRVIPPSVGPPAAGPADASPQAGKPTDEDLKLLGLAKSRIASTSDPTFVARVKSLSACITDKTPSTVMTQDLRNWLRNQQPIDSSLPVTQQPPCPAPAALH